jgi:hypothetical protein
MDDKNIKYTNKTFSDFKESLHEFAKIYFPNTYNDFSDASPGNMFIEMASYVGDVSSFFIDSQIQESFLTLAKEKESLYNISYASGYVPKATYASTTNVEINQLVPSINGQPDLSYTLIIPAYTTITSNNDFQKFITTSDVDFSLTSSAEINIFNNDYFIIKKSIPVISAEIKSVTANFSSPIKFNSFNINDSNIIQILEISGSNNERWYEVPYLAQNTIFLSSPNPTSGSDNINNILNIKNVPRRFITRLKPNNNLEIQFGSGISSKNDEVILPTPENINLGLISSVGDMLNNYNSLSPLFSKSYGLAPSGELNIQYLVGGGINTNVDSNTLTNLDTSNSNNWFKYAAEDDGVKSFILSQILCTNPLPSTGGRGGDTIEEIRLNALNSFSAQNRAVTQEDYIMRAISMPSVYGNVSKAYITQDIIKGESNNPFSLDLYILTYNSNKNLILANNTLKNNLKTYLNEYKISTDSINIKNAFYINLGINFDITIDPSFNNKELIANCIIELKKYFNIEKWQINQPIIISEITSTLIKVPGVRSVPKIDIVNKQGNEYSPHGYDIESAIRNGILYPSIDPSIFEIRFPDNDIKGRIITY